MIVNMPLALYFFLAINWNTASCLAVNPYSSCSSSAIYCFPFFMKFQSQFVLVQQVVSSSGMPLICVSSKKSMPEINNKNNRNQSAIPKVKPIKYIDF